MPISPELSQNKLLELANRTLGVPASSVRLFPPNLTGASYSLETQRDAIPDGYLEELRKHTNFSKDDTLFYIYPEPGYGCKSTRLSNNTVPLATNYAPDGEVSCLEKGCGGVSVKLTSRRGTGDDGLQSGIGSLSAYRVRRLL
jgi:hypothetical protein